MLLEESGSRLSLSRQRDVAAQVTALGDDFFAAGVIRRAAFIVTCELAALNSLIYDRNLFSESRWSIHGL